MYEVASNTRRVNGVDVETWEREIIDANILFVEAGTNGCSTRSQLKRLCASPIYLRLKGA